MKVSLRPAARLAGGVLVVVFAVAGLAELREHWRVVMLPFRVARLSFAAPDPVLAMPVAGATLARVTNTWHAPRPGARRHEGQDIFAARGTAVFSATPGIVVRRGENRLGGLVVMVAGRGARVYYYAHLDAWAAGLQVGDEVTTGTLLGFVGTSGNARETPPHLHFGVYGPGGAIDPQPLLRDR